MTKNYNSVPIGGDFANEECSKCGSKNTIFEEYIKSNTADESELGIICDDCEHQEEPDDFEQRFVPTEPEDNGIDSDSNNQIPIGDA